MVPAPELLGTTCERHERRHRRLVQRARRLGRLPRRLGEQRAGRGTRGRVRRATRGASVGFWWGGLLLYDWIVLLVGYFVFDFVLED